MPARAIWKGAISFGLVSIPVKTYGAIQEHKTGMKMLCPKCKSPLQYKRFCPKGHGEIAWDDIIKGYEIERGKFIPLTKTDLEKLDFKAGRLIEIFQFVDLDNLDPIYFDNSYYLVPDANGEKPYFLLRQALEEYNKIALGRFVFHEKEHLVALRPYEGAVLMETLHYADEIRTPGEFAELKAPVDIDKEELELAGQLIRILKKPFAYKEYKDRYQEALSQLVEAKSKGEELVEVRVPEIKPTKDLMETLKASIRAQGRR